MNPLAGCLPTLITLPVWIGLYRALSNVADEGLLTEGFFWIPSLAGPTSLAAQKAVRFLSPVGIVPSSCMQGLAQMSRTHSPCCSEYRQKEPIGRLTTSSVSKADR